MRDILCYTVESYKVVCSWLDQHSFSAPNSRDNKGTTSWIAHQWTSKVLCLQHISGFDRELLNKLAGKMASGCEMAMLKQQ